MLVPLMEPWLPLVCSTLTSDIKVGGGWQHKHLLPQQPASSTDADPAVRWGCSCGGLQACTAALTLTACCHHDHAAATCLMRCG